MNPIYLVTNCQPGESDILVERNQATLKIRVTDGFDQNEVLAVEPSNASGWTHELIDQTLSRTSPNWYLKGYAYDAYLDKFWIGSTEC